MRGFDDVIERGSKPTNRTSESFRERPKPKQSPETSILELVEGLNIEGLSSNLNPEMKQKVLVPLANLLDKYGIADSLGESNTAQAGLGLFSLLGDVAPVIKGLAESISGQKNALKAEDMEFLKKIKESQNDSEFSDLFVSEESNEPKVAPQPAPIVGPNGENISAINMNVQEVDWWAVMGVENPEDTKIRQMPQAAQTYMAKGSESKLPTYGLAGERPVITGLPSLDDLAAEVGMTVDELNEPKSGDDYRKLENESLGEDLESITFTEDEADSLLSELDVDSIYEIDFESED